MLRGAGRRRGGRLSVRGVWVSSANVPGFWRRDRKLCRSAPPCRPPIAKPTAVGAEVVLLCSGAHVQTQNLLRWALRLVLLCSGAHVQTHAPLRCSQNKPHRPSSLRFCVTASLNAWPRGRFYRAVRPALRWAFGAFLAPGGAALRFAGPLGLFLLRAAAPFLRAPGCNQAKPAPPPP